MRSLNDFFFWCFFLLVCTTVLIWCLILLLFSFFCFSVFTVLPIEYFVYLYV